MLNKAILMGRLTRDPEIKYTQNSVAVCTFAIAVDRDYVQQGGQRQTDFINIVAWRKTAEFICKYFTKGRMIVVCGSIQTRTWDGADGRKNYTTEIIADDVYFGDSKKENSEGTSNYYSAVPAPQAPAQFAGVGNAEPIGNADPFESVGNAGGDFTSVPPAAPSGGDFVPIDTDDDLPF
ncbi:MAG: single-stranded DNA-binding protein [Oscillospiraceae bacterium]|nr:single-stranded DNA-binding protein [Oscillospiraceae bacterium]